MSYVELYKKYRPNVWENVIGQDKIVNSLKAVLKKDKLPSAYIFAGPRGCGKTTAALLLAKSVNCENVDKDCNPCNECDVCISIDENNNMGVEYFSAAQKSGVDDIRELVQRADLKTSIKKRVIIIDEIHNLSQGKGFEALLIPLERADLQALFIFCTTEINKVPKTILSRVQQKKFTLVDSETMLEHVKHINEVEELDLSEEELINAVRLGKGSVRDTLTHLENIVETGEEETGFGIQLLEKMSTRNIVEVLEVVAEANNNSVDFAKFSEQLFEDLRDLLLLASGSSKDLVNVPLENDAIKRIVKGLLGKNGIMLLMNNLGDSLTSMTNSADPRILLEIALIKGLADIKKLGKKMQASRGE